MVITNRTSRSTVSIEVSCAPDMDDRSGRPFQPDAMELTAHYDRSGRLLSFAPLVVTGALLREDGSRSTTTVRMELLESELHLLPRLLEIEYTDMMLDLPASTS